MTEQRLTADITTRVRNLLRTCDVAAGLILHAADNLCGFEQILGGTGIQPDEIRSSFSTCMLTAFHCTYDNLTIPLILQTSPPWPKGFESAGNLPITELSIEITRPGMI